MQKRSRIMPQMIAALAAMGMYHNPLTRMNEKMRAKRTGTSNRDLPMDVQEELIQKAAAKRKRQRKARADAVYFSKQSYHPLHNYPLAV